MSRYVVSKIDKPYVVMTYDCPGMERLCREFIPVNFYEIIVRDEYETEFRFMTEDMQLVFIEIVKRYIADEYNDILEKLWEEDAKND